MKEEAAKRMKKELKAADAAILMFDVSAFASATARQVMFDGRQSRFAETTARHEHGIAEAEEEGPRATFIQKACRTRYAYRSMPRKSCRHGVRRPHGIGC